MKNVSNAGVKRKFAVVSTISLPQMLYFIVKTINYTTLHVLTKNETKILIHVNHGKYFVRNIH